VTVCKLCNGHVDTAQSAVVALIQSRCFRRGDRTVILSWWLTDQVLPSVTDSWYRNQLSAAVLKLQESGKLAKMKNRWWKEERGGGKCAVSCCHY